MYKNLLLEFWNQNKILLISTIVILFFTFPMETLLIPNLYGKLFNPSGSKDKEKYLLKILIIIIGLWVVIRFFYFSLTFLIEKIKLNFVKWIRIKLFSKIIENYETDFKEISVSTSSKILAISDRLERVINYVLQYLTPLFFCVLLILIYLLFLDWKIALVGFVLFFIYTIVFLKISYQIVVLAGLREEKTEDMTKKMNDSLDNLLNVYINNQKDTEISKLTTIQDGYNNANKNMARLINKMSFSTSIFSVAIFGIMMGMTFFQWKKKKFSFEKFITISLILTYLLGNLINISSWSPEELENFGIILYSKDFIDEIIKPKDKSYIPNANLEGDIIVKNISFSYEPDSFPIFDNFSFKIMKGLKSAIVGSSGSGKSTLMKLLLGLNRPSKGTIYINGIPVDKIDPKYLRNEINYINQRTSLFQGTVVDNIKYGNNISNKEIERLLKKYDLMTNFSGLKNGIYTDVGMQGKGLSGGMQKIVMNMRGILRKGTIIIFDEPLAGLDSATRKKMIKFIFDMTKGKTLIVITHDPEILPYMNKVIKLKDQK